MMSDQIERGEKGTYVDETHLARWRRSEVMIGSVGDNEGGKEVAEFASTVMLLPSLHSVCVRLCRQLHLNVHSWREWEGERRCNLHLTYQQHTKLITFHTKQRFGISERWKATPGDWCQSADWTNERTNDYLQIECARRHRRQKDDEHEDEDDGSSTHV